MPFAPRHRGLLPGILIFSFGVASLAAGPLPEIQGVHNFHQVNEHIYRGAQPSDAGFSNLAKFGIKTVVDLRGQKSEADEVQRAGLHYIRMHWDGFRAPSEEQMNTVLAMLNDSSQWPIFVHCRRGADRTGTAIACYRISHDHWSNQQALAEAKDCGMSSLEIKMQHYILGFAAGAPAKPALALNPAALLVPAPPAP
jgi:protein tyrosine/serine phosphatase